MVRFARKARTARRPFAATSVTAGLGAPILAAAVLVLGLANLARGDFTIVYHPMPNALPLRPVVAALCNAVLAATGAAILARRHRHLAAALLGVDMLVLSIGWLTRVALFPGMSGTWLGLAEQVAIALGAFAIAAAGRPGTIPPAVFRIGFGLCQLVFGLAHFLSLAETIAMTPAYLPFGARFWALATGVVHLFGGMLLIAGIRPLLATRCLAAMFVVFQLLVWLPALVGAPQAPHLLAGNLINLALVGAVLAIGEATAPRSR